METWRHGGVNISQGWTFLRGEYFSGVNIFQGWRFSKGEYFSGVNIFQGWLFFRGEYTRGEYFSEVNIFQGSIFFRGEYFCDCPSNFHFILSVSPVNCVYFLLDNTLRNSVSDTESSWIALYWIQSHSKWLCIEHSKTTSKLLRTILICLRKLWKEVQNKASIYTTQRKAPQDLFLL